MSLCIVLSLHDLVFITYIYYFQSSYVPISHQSSSPSIVSDHVSIACLASIHFYLSYISHSCTCSNLCSLLSCLCILFSQSDMSCFRSCLIGTHLRLSVLIMS